MTRWIMHIDMDAFFASVEQYRVHPEYCGLPLCVGHDPKGGIGRGVVRAVSYEARAFGIRSGMPVTEAYRLCPNAIFVSGPYSNYTEASREFMDILPDFADGGRVRQASIDEAYIEITNKVKNHETPKDLANALQKTIKDYTKLPCSIGIGPNMAVAKIATGLNKPNGITIVPQNPRAVAQFLAPLNVRAISGIGKITAQRLEKHGVKTLGDVQRLSLAELQPIMGKGSSWLRKRAWGLDDRLLKDNGPHIRKSISKDRTFMQDINPQNIDLLQGTIDNLCSKIWQKVNSKDLLFRTITLKMRYADYTTIQRSRTLSVGTGEQSVLCKTAFNLFEEKRYLNQPIRLLGVKVSNLIRLQDQMSLSEYI